MFLDLVPYIFPLVQTGTTSWSAIFFLLIWPQTSDSPSYQHMATKIIVLELQSN